jgi:hypothetical protein
MEECREDEEEDHHDERADSAIGVEAGSEETEQADLGDVKADEEVLQSAWVYGAASVDSGVVNVKKVVAVREVEEEDAYGGKDENERSDAGIANGYDMLSAWYLELEYDSLPMTIKLVMIGKTWPQPTPASLFHRKKILRGVEPSNHTRIGVMNRPAIPTSMLAKTARPCRTM